MNNNISADICKIQSILGSPLVVPYYQRPYKWRTNNVIQLLDDIYSSFNEKKESYRIGSLILHNENEKLNIVDGQQRLVTICLILHKLQESQRNIIELSLFKSSFSHIESKNNIKFNYHSIEQWLQKLVTQQEKDSYKNYILTHCEFVKIEINNLNEAFQLFDSQNARGKALEPYDLLKAFHLREMFNNTQNEKLLCVKKWEEQIDNNDLLGRIISQYLYRIRKWSKNENAYEFTKDDINEFKGINLDLYKSYPYLKPYIMNDVTTSNMELNKINYCFTNKIDYPFQINQIILNGKRFFEYINYYASIHEHFFVKNKSNFYSFYEAHVKYNGWYRKGDTYIRKMFKALIILYNDKFGEVSFEDQYKYLYRWSYALRLKLSCVRYESIDKYIRENGNPFKMIVENYHPFQISEIKRNIPIFNEVEISNEKVKKIGDQNVGYSVAEIEVVFKSEQL